MKYPKAGWALVRLEEVCEINPRGQEPIDSGMSVSFVPMPAVSDQEGVILEHSCKPFSQVAKGYTRFVNGDVIFAKITPCMENGKIAVAKDLVNGFACGSTEFHVLRSNGSVVPEYVWYFLRQKKFRAEAERSMTGAVGQRRVPTQYLKDFMIPIPPLNEQRRIVTKLDSLLARSRRAREELARVSLLVERYKQAVLAAAFRVQLIDDENASQKSNSSWAKTTLGSLLTDIRYGTAKKCYHDHVGTPVLRIPNIGNGIVNVADLKFTTLEAKERQKLSLLPDDILIIRSNGSLDLVGKAAIVGNCADGFAFAGYLIRMRLETSRVLPEFVLYFLKSPAVRQDIERLAKSTSGVNNINSEELRSLSIEYPSIDGQRVIIVKIKKLFRLIEYINEEVQGALALLDRFDQAALSKAFRGDLVPQDQNDEPASALLERFKSEASEAPKPRRGRKPKKSVEAA